MAFPIRTEEVRRRPASEGVERLAKRTGHVIALAQKVYDAEYDKLRKGAKVTDFVGVLALRHTRERLLAMQRDRRAVAANTSYELFSA